MSTKKLQPYAPFGQALKQLRKKTKKTPREVSGAVEIDLSRLDSYEKGEIRPSEDILLLLIQHFDLPDDQAVELWRLAGYGDLPMDEQLYFTNDVLDDYDHDFEHSVPSIISVSLDQPPIVYTDMIQVMVNNFGVVMNFMQGASASSVPLAVARIGMSKEHAKSVLAVLQKTLDQADEMERKAKQSQKHLPPGNSL